MKAALLVQQVWFSQDGQMLQIYSQLTWGNGNQMSIETDVPLGATVDQINVALRSQACQYAACQDSELVVCTKFF